MAINAEQVKEAIEQIKVAKRNKSGSVNRNSVYAVLVRFKAAHWFTDFEDNAFSKEIHEFAFNFIKENS